MRNKNIFYTKEYKFLGSKKGSTGCSKLRAFKSVFLDHYPQIFNTPDFYIPLQYSMIPAFPDKEIFHSHK